jgi:hypothetical protein
MRWAVFLSTSLSPSVCLSTHWWTERRRLSLSVCPTACRTSTDRGAAERGLLPRGAAGVCGLHLAAHQGAAHAAVGIHVSVSSCLIEALMCRASRSTDSNWVRRSRGAQAPQGAATDMGCSADSNWVCLSLGAQALQGAAADVGGGADAAAGLGAAADAAHCAHRDARHAGAAAGPSLGWA